MKPHKLSKLATLTVVQVIKDKYYFINTSFGDEVCLKEKTAKKLYKTLNKLFGGK